MIRSLKLWTFKSFREAELAVEPLTVLVGTIASGKTNLREALRFLHGIGRGYTLADIIGEKRIEGGSLVWTGMRGGLREISFNRAGSFGIKAELGVGETSYTYRIRVRVGTGGRPPVVSSESLWRERERVFSVTGRGASSAAGGRDRRLRVDGMTGAEPWSVNAEQPVLSQIERHVPGKKDKRFHADVSEVSAALRAMNFIDLVPDAMRQPSVPGQDVLGERGENLSSVLQAICKQPRCKRTLLEWVKQLTPLDVVDLRFQPDLAGRVLLVLVEKGGRKISAHSASDGTLRFLGILAALMGPRAAPFHFIEEIENAVHSTRLHLLTQLLEQRVARHRTQIVVTTHSPYLLQFVGRDNLTSAALVYRDNGTGSRVTRVLDIPEARRVFGEHDVAGLVASGWLEDAVSFSRTANGKGRT